MGSVCSRSVVDSVATPRSPPGPGPAPAAAAAYAADQAMRPPPGFKTKRRGSVSAEPSGAGFGSKKSKVVPKTDSARLRIKEIIKSTLLFKELDEEQQIGIIDAMFERQMEAGEVVIREGEEGDNFYAIESGTFAASVAGQQKFLYEGKGSFGELALMYNCPRAATVTAQSVGVLWALDRATFRSLVVGSMVERRQRHEESLTGMPIFQHLTREQLAAIADCLSPETYQPGEVIIHEGEELPSDAKFYIIESGKVECYRTFEGTKRPTKTLRAGDVFGEVALLTKAARQADCMAATQVTCLTMRRDAFERLMGPVEESLARQIAIYNQLNAGHGSLSTSSLARQGDSSSGGGAGAADERLTRGSPGRSTSGQWGSPFGSDAEGHSGLPDSPSWRGEDEARRIEDLTPRVACEGEGEPACLLEPIAEESAGEGVGATTAPANPAKPAHPAHAAHHAQPATPAKPAGVTHAGSGKRTHAAARAQHSAS